MVRGLATSRSVVQGLAWLGIAALVAALLALAHEPTRSALGFIWSRLHGTYTEKERVTQHGSAVRKRLAPLFAQAQVSYPPAEVTLVAFKDTRLLDLYARDSSSEAWRFIKRYEVRGASGKPGPKLAEGDYQVPEGLYRAEFLNPNSRFHLSIRLNYPNEFDRQMAQLDGRTRLGGDIMIHGGSSSVGCLAVGDDAAEDLFVLTALVTKEKTRILVSPTDFRLPGKEAALRQPSWVPELYERIRSELGQFPHHPGPTTKG